MLKTFVSAFFLCTTALPGFAACVGESYLDRLSADQTATLDQKVAELPYAEGLIWRAKRGPDQITVIGTMHIYDPRLEAIRAQVKEVVTSADILLVEATPEDEAALQALVATDPGVLFITQGPTLPEQLDPDTWALIVEAATARGIPGFMAAKMQPWYLSMMLAIPPCAMADLASGQPGLDKMLMADATAAGVPLQAVEEVTALFEMFSAETPDDQIAMLRAGLMTPDLQGEMFVAMLDSYFAEEIGRLWEMSRLALQDMPGITADQAELMFAQMQTALLDQRNRNWMSVIAAAADTHDDLVLAVGAAHLIGDQGVLQLLAEEGWQITAQTSP